MFEGEKSIYWIAYKLFVCVDSYSKPHIIGIKAGWFSLVYGIPKTTNTILKSLDPSFMLASLLCPTFMMKPFCHDPFNFISGQS